MGLNSRLREEFSFLRGNVLVMMTSWLVVNFAVVTPNTYYSHPVLGLGGTPFVIGTMRFISFLTLASAQFPARGQSTIAIGGTFFAEV